jgi:hypothetical protein
MADWQIALATWHAFKFLLGLVVGAIDAPVVTPAAPPAIERPGEIGAREAAGQYADVE